MKLNFVDLFAGLGGFALGAQMAGLEIDNHYFSEIEDYAQKVYTQNFPNAVALGDIRQINGAKLRKKHPGKWLVCGGFPCQNISTAGQQEGISGDRSSLWFEMHRVIDELRPEVVVVENVRALTSHGLERVLFSLAASGYSAEWDVVSAAEVGAPHRRQRVWIVAYPDRLSGAVIERPPADQRDVGDGLEPNGAAHDIVPWSEGERIETERSFRARPLVCRVSDGLPDQLDRLEALGNAVVPQVAAAVLRRVRPLLV